MYEELFWLQKVKPANGNESEPMLHSGKHDMNGVDTDHTSKAAESGQSSKTPMAPQVILSLCFH